MRIVSSIGTTDTYLEARSFKPIVEGYDVHPSV